MSREELMDVTPEMALRHPTWNMGNKISIDSSTMMNKGLEVIEAVHLFGFPVSMIKVVIHPESIIHSMVEYTDNSITAQLALPDMRLPIQYALTFPHREMSKIPEMDITAISKLTFEQPDMEAFPCLRLAVETADTRGTAGAILNGANEAAVDLFLQGKLKYNDIYVSICSAMESIKNIEEPTVEEIITAGEQAQSFVYSQKGIL
jgi:1-deoxy-D-xylulose-5-phosphate reductoisomerase